MPELPDVENFRRYFEATSLDKEIVAVKSNAEELIKNIDFVHFRKELIGRSFISSRRRGKFLVITIKASLKKLVIHFGMTGGFYYFKDGSIIDEGVVRFSRLYFEFKNKDILHWLNIRKLGKIYLVKNLEEISLIKEMGPEPLELSKKEFLKLLDKSIQRNIKAFLLDQRRIAGIGNIYSDEILFQAKINPHRKIKTLSSDEKERIYFQMKEVLESAIKIGPPSGAFNSSWLLSHRNKNGYCPRNKNHKLKKEIIANRPAIYCSFCQR